MGAKKHRRNGRSHVGETFVEHVPLIFSPCELWHRLDGSTVLRYLLIAVEVLVTKNFVTCQHNVPKSLLLLFPRLQTNKDQRYRVSKFRTKLSLFHYGGVFGVTLVDSRPLNTYSLVCLHIPISGNVLRHSSLKRH